jgi:hypothetical protein
VLLAKWLVVGAAVLVWLVVVPVVDLIREVLHRLTGRKRG